MTLIAGVDSSTQSTKVVIREAETGEFVRAGRATHPEGTSVDPRAWWHALEAAAADAGGLEGVAALAVGAQQHGMVALDERGDVVRDALLWNDTRSADDAEALVEEGGGPQAWADATGSVPVASFTVTKLRWLARCEPENAARTAAVGLPHDWLTWYLRGSPGLEALSTDRGDASGTGYFAPVSGQYRRELLHLALGRDDLVLPVVLDPAASAGGAGSGLLPGLAAGTPLGAGTGDNMAAALGVGAGPGDVVVSIGTSGTVFAVADAPAADPSGAVAGFADATGRFLPLVCTLNAARVLDAVARLLGVDHAGLDALALAAPAGAGGLVLLPFLEGERTPNLPAARASLHGATLDNTTPAHLARAAVEGLVCGLAAGLDALVEQGLSPRRVLLVGGGARSSAVQQVGAALFGLPVVVPAPGEYVADGAARQAAWVLAGGEAPPVWESAGTTVVEADPAPAVRAQYHDALVREFGERLDR